MNFYSNILLTKCSGFSPHSQEMYMLEPKRERVVQKNPPYHKPR